MTACFCTGACAGSGKCPNQSAHITPLYPPYSPYPSLPQWPQQPFAPVTPSLPKGWVCPKCQIGVAPTQLTCPKCIPAFLPDPFAPTLLTETSTTLKVSASDQVITDANAKEWRDGIEEEE